MESPTKDATPSGPKGRRRTSSAAWKDNTNGQFSSLSEHFDYQESAIYMSMFKNTRIAVYLRVSDRAQAVRNQVPAIERWMNYKFPKFGQGTNGLRAFDVYVDHDTGRKTDRESWGKLFNAMQARKYDHIVAWCVDRVHRDAGHMCMTINAARAAGCHMHFVQEGLSTDNMMGQFMVKVFALFGEMELAIKDERQAAGIARARAEGKHLGRAPDMGYDVEVFEMMRANPGISISAVARHFGKSRDWARKAMTRVSETSPSDSPMNTRSRKR